MNTFMKLLKLIIKCIVMHLLSLKIMTQLHRYVATNYINV